MNVSLTPELERLVSRKVASGSYGSASEVVREALRLLADRDEVRKAQLDELKSAVSLGLRQLEARRRRPFDAVALRRIQAAGRRKLALFKRR